MLNTLLHEERNREIGKDDSLLVLRRMPPKKRKITVRQMGAHFEGFLAIPLLSKLLFLLFSIIFRCTFFLFHPASPPGSPPNFLDAFLSKGKIFPRSPASLRPNLRRGNGAAREKLAKSKLERKS